MIYDGVIMQLPPAYSQTAVPYFIHFPIYRSFAESTPIQNTVSRVNVISNGAPSRSRIVLRISFGITSDRASGRKKR